MTENVVETTVSDDVDEPVTTSPLEEEGEAAADYLEELLDIADLDGDIDIGVEHDRIALASRQQQNAARQTTYNMI